MKKNASIILSIAFLAGCAGRSPVVSIPVEVPSVGVSSSPVIVVPAKKHKKKQKHHNGRCPAGWERYGDDCYFY